MIKTLVKKAAAMPGLSAFPRHITRHRPAILMYHGLSGNPETQDWTQVRIDDFKTQMRYLRDHCRPVSLGHLAAFLETGDIAPHSVAVTFDDGYKSNYDSAYPILKELGIPATIFVTSGFILQREEHHRYLWPDFITALLKTRAGQKLDLEDYGFGQYDLTSPRNIYASREALCEHLKSIAATETDRIILDLYKKHNESLDHARFADYRPMTAEQLRSLASGDLVTIGAHSRTHPILSRLAPDMLEEEIVGSKRDLEEMTGAEITEFAYPNGRRQDINGEAYELTTRNFDCAVTTEAGLNPIGHDKYLLRRIGIGRNLGIPEFKTQLSGIYYMFQKKITGI